MQTNVQMKLLDKIDLTGDEVVVSTEVIQQQIPVVDLENMNDDDHNNTIDEVKKMKCEICLDEEFKYKCPACNVKTCCLACVNKHKNMTSCTGERDKTEFVKKNEFNNFNLLSDYRFLEDANRIADNAKRDYKTKGTTRVPKRDILLYKAAAKSGVKLVRMARGMVRWKENKSYYIIKEQEIYWTVRFIFDDNKEEVVLKCGENNILEDILKDYIDINVVSPENKIRFASYVNSKDINDVIDVYFQRDIEPDTDFLKYVKCNIKESIKSALNNKAVLEYPIFHVVLPATSKQLMNQPYTKGSPMVSNGKNDAPQHKKPRLES